MLDAVDVTKFLPRLERLRCSIANEDHGQFGPRQNVLVQLFSIPSTIVHLEITQDVLTRLDPASLINAFARSSSLVKLTFGTSVETADMVLQTIGNQLKALQLSIWGQQGNKIPASHLTALLAYAPNLTSLRLSTLGYNQLKEVDFPPMLQKLVIDYADFRVVERTVELLAIEPEWCPNLTHIPHFKSIANIKFLQNTHKGQARLEAFKNVCLRPEGVLESRPDLSPASEAQLRDLLDQIAFTSDKQASLASGFCYNRSPGGRTRILSFRRGAPAGTSNWDAHMHPMRNRMSQWRIGGNGRRQRTPTMFP